MHSNGLRTACQRTSPTKPQGCRQANIPKTPRRTPAATIFPVRACMSLCVVRGRLYLSSSSSVLLMETGLFAVDGYRMLSTHTLGTKPSSDECSNIAVTPNASTHYTHTILVLLVVASVRWPFSLVSESLSLARSLVVTLPPTLIGSLLCTPPSPLHLIHWAVITLSDSSCCFWARARAVSLVLASVEKPAVGCLRCPESLRTARIWSRPSVQVERTILNILQK